MRGVSRAEQGVPCQVHQVTFVAISRLTHNQPKVPVKVFSATHVGFESHLVTIEVAITNGLSNLEIVGLPDTSVKESKQRVYLAMKSCGVEYPRQRKIINLAPAELPKHGPSFDLPMAIGLLQASGQIAPAFLEKTLFIGELGLDGEVRKVKGAIGAALLAEQQGFRKIFLPEENALEASFAANLEIYPIKHFSEIITNSFKLYEPSPFDGSLKEASGSHREQSGFENILGQEHAKRALMIAATGGHNILLSGPPGSGKTLLGRHLQSILPLLSREESLEVTKIHSLAGKLSPKCPIMLRPPFRTIHHSASPVSIIGGGNVPRPGEISLSHRGVLFLDELLEFPRSSLEALRQPLEDGEITVHRASYCASFPARFLLVAATNPCPCGYLGDPEKSCVCLPAAIAKYRKKLSGPLLDRIDLLVEVPRLAREKLEKKTGDFHSEGIRERIALARLRQDTRFGRRKNNSEMSPEDFDAMSIAQEAKHFLQQAYDRFHLSPRAYFRILKVAQTIADLENKERIEESHVAEALQYRFQTSI